MADHDKKQADGFTPIGLCMGLGIGLCFGTAMGNMGAGICMGLGIGLCFSVALGHQKDSGNKPDGDSGEDQE